MVKTTAAYIAGASARFQADNANDDTQFSANAKAELVELYRATAARARAHGRHGIAWRWERAAKAIEAGTEPVYGGE